MCAFEQRQCPINNSRMKFLYPNMEKLKVSTFKGLKMLALDLFAQNPVFHLCTMERMYIFAAAH